MKTISWVTPSYFLDTDLYVMRYLPKYFRIKWYLIKNDGQKFDNEEIIEKISQHENIDIIRVNLVGKFYSLSYFRQLKELQKKIGQSTDFVYQPSGFIFTLPLIMWYGKKDKWIIPIHNVKTPKGARLYWLSKLYNDITISYFKHFATFSSSQYKLLNKVKNGNCDILPASFMLKDYGAAANKRSNELITFMNFGNIIEYKRIDVLIEAAQQAYEHTHIKFRVLLAGACKKWNHYAALIRYPELFDLRIARVEDCEIPNIFEESDYFVAPYQDIAQSGSVVVAINYNKPIIASKIEAFEDFVEDGVDGFLIKPASIEDLRDKIIYIINNHYKIYTKLQQNQKKMVVEKFQDEVILKKYVDYLNSIVE